MTSQNSHQVKLSLHGDAVMRKTSPTEFLLDIQLLKGLELFQTGKIDDPTGNNYDSSSSGSADNLLAGQYLGTDCLQSGSEAPKRIRACPLVWLDGILTE